MVHGGAGALDNVKDSKSAVRYLESIRGVLEHGRQVLVLGGSALQAAEACACLLEDDPVFNAGCGSVLNEFGKVEMDAAIMDGRDLTAGSVAAVSTIANPVQAARVVLAKSEHVMLIGEGAEAFAHKHGIKSAEPEYFFTEERIAQLNQARQSNTIVLDHETINEDHKYGTIGAIAYDQKGNLAAATSTGGMVNKRHGRVGDSPIVGAGVYADNETCAVSATGYGEDFMRTTISKTISDFIYMKELDAEKATKAGIEYLTRKVKGRGGVIVIDKDGNCASGFTTKKMIHGWIEHGGKTFVRF